MGLFSKKNLPNPLIDSYDTKEEYAILIQNDDGRPIGFITRGKLTFQGKELQNTYNLRDLSGQVLKSDTSIEYLVEKEVPQRKEELEATARKYYRENELNQILDSKKNKDIDKGIER